MAFKGSHHFYGNEATSAQGVFQPSTYEPPQQYPVANTYPTASVAHAQITRGDANPNYHKLKNFLKLGHKRDVRPAEPQLSPTTATAMIHYDQVLGDSQSFSRYPAFAHSASAASANGSTLHAHPHRRLPDRDPNRFDGRPNLPQLTGGVMKNPSRNPPDEDPDWSDDSVDALTPVDGLVPTPALYPSANPIDAAAAQALAAQHPYSAPSIAKGPSYHDFDTLSTTSTLLNPPSVHNAPIYDYNPAIHDTNPHVQATSAAVAPGVAPGPHGSTFHQVQNHGLLAVPPRIRTTSRSPSHSPSRDSHRSHRSHRSDRSRRSERSHRSGRSESRYRGREGEGTTLQTVDVPGVRPIAVEYVGSNRSKDGRSSSHPPGYRHREHERDSKDGHSEHRRHRSDDYHRHHHHRHHDDYYREHGTYDDNHPAHNDHQYSSSRHRSHSRGRSTDRKSPSRSRDRSTRSRSRSAHGRNVLRKKRSSRSVNQDPIADTAGVDRDEEENRGRRPSWLPKGIPLLSKPTSTTNPAQMATTSPWVGSLSTSTNPAGPEVVYAQQGGPYSLQTAPYASQMAPSSSHHSHHSQHSQHSQHSHKSHRLIKSRPKPTRSAMRSATSHSDPSSLHDRMQMNGDLHPHFPAERMSTVIGVQDADYTDALGPPSPQHSAVDVAETVDIKALLKKSRERSARRGRSRSRRRGSRDSDDSDSDSDSGRSRKSGKSVKAKSSIKSLRNAFAGMGFSRSDRHDGGSGYHQDNRYPSSTPYPTSNQQPPPQAYPAPASTYAYPTNPSTYGAQPGYPYTSPNAYPYASPSSPYVATTAAYPTTSTYAPVNRPPAHAYPSPAHVHQAAYAPPGVGHYGSPSLHPVRPSLPQRHSHPFEVREYRYPLAGVSDYPQI